MDDATRAARTSLATGVGVLALKAAAAHLTGSVALWSDALESVVNVVAAGIALFAVRLSATPADENHPWGHAKAEAFSAGAEGVLIVLAAAAIVRSAADRLLSPAPVESLGAGLAVSLAATIANGLLAAHLVRTGRRLHSPALVADGQHVRADVVTSVGVLAGVGLAGATGGWVLDPLLALGVALNVVWSGLKLVREAGGTLMDESLPPAEVEALRALLVRDLPPGVSVDRLRARRAARHLFVEAVLRVPSAMTVGDSHALCDTVEARIGTEFPQAETTLHVEPAPAP